MKCLVLNPKGGVCKSSVATQIVAPYIYRFSKTKVPYFEFDLHNDDILGFEKSKIIEPHLYQKEKEIPNLIDELEFAEHAVVDLGGNASTSILLDYFAKTGTVGNFDLIITPFGDSDLDIKGAIEVYKQLSKEWDFAVVQALTRVSKTDQCNLEDQFFHYFGDINNIVDGRLGLREEFNKKDQNYILLPTDSAITLSRCFGETIYEIGIKDRSKLTSTKMKAQANGNKKEFMKCNKLLRFYEYCSFFTKEVLNPAFKVFDTVLNSSEEKE